MIAVHPDLQLIASYVVVFRWGGAGPSHLSILTLLFQTEQLRHLLETRHRQRVGRQYIVIALEQYDGHSRGAGTFDVVEYRVTDVQHAMGR